MNESDFRPNTSGLQLGMSMHWEPPLGIVATRFETFELSIRSFRVPLTRAIKEVVAPSMGQNFLQSGRPTPWLPLSDITVSIKEAQGSQWTPTAPLLRSGLLYKTIQQLNIWAITSTQATLPSLPSKVAYGMYHQVGTRNMPMRAFAEIQPEDEDKIEAVFDDWITEKIVETLVF